MSDIKDFYYFKAKRAVNLINSDSITEQNSKLPAMLSDEDFHNSLCLYFLKASDDIRNCTDEDERFKLRNSRLVTLYNYVSILKTTMDDLAAYYNQINLEFTDDNNGEELLDYLQDSEYIANFIRFRKKYENSPQLKSSLEDMVYTSHNYSDAFFEYGPNEMINNIQNHIKELRVLFPDENMSYQDATILYAQLNIHIHEMLLNADILANASMGNQSNTNENYHHAVYIDKKALNKLFKDMQKTHDLTMKETSSEDNPEMLETDFNHLQSLLFPFKTRSAYSVLKKVGVTTRELENMLLNIMTYSYDNLITYIQFLLDNKIKLPLSQNKCELYPLFFIDFDNETIQKAFSIENSDEMLDMNAMRKILLTPDERKDVEENLIHLEPKTTKIPIDPLFREK